MEYEQMRKMEKTHVCAQCESPLVTIWDGENDRYRLVCAADRKHEGYQQIMTASQMVVRGRADEIMGKGAQKDLEDQFKKGIHALSQVPKVDLGTGEVITRDKMLALIAWGNSLGLKPYLGHVCLYHGNPYVTIDGYYYLNNQRDRPYRVSARPANDDERRQHQVDEGDYFYIAEAWLEDLKLPVIGLGIATKGETEAKSERHPEQYRAPVVHDHPQRIAEKRAEWQLLRKLLPLKEVE